MSFTQTITPLWSFIKRRNIMLIQFENRNIGKLNNSGKNIKAVKTLQFINEKKINSN